METPQLIFFAVIAFLLIGALSVALLRVILSRGVGLDTKGVLLALVAVIGFQAWALIHMKANPVLSKEYRFFDMAHSDPSGSKVSIDNFIKVEGSWKSNAKLNMPWQTTSLECFRDRKLCVDATVHIRADKKLMIVTTYWEIEDWNTSEIRLKEDSSAVCTTDRLRIDRRSEVVTMTRIPKSPLPDACQGMSTDSITMFLDVGVKFSEKNV